MVLQYTTGSHQKWCFASLQMTSICNFALKTEPAAILESIGEHYQHLFFIIIKKNHSVEENIWLTWAWGSFITPHLPGLYAQCKIILSVMMSPSPRSREQGFFCIAEIWMICRCSPISLAFPILLYPKGITLQSGCLLVVQASGNHLHWLLWYSNDLDMCVYANWLRNNFHTQKKNKTISIWECVLSDCVTWVLHCLVLIWTIHFLTPHFQVLLLFKLLVLSPNWLWLK